jgi:hypothetical protein
MVELICSCGHLDKEHGQFGLICQREDMYRPKAACPCNIFILDDQLYAEQMDKEYYGRS